MIVYINNYAIFNNIKFKKDLKTGYYLNSTLRIRLHRYVWEFYNNKIPTGYQIHHIDYNKENNNIENLQILSIKEHMQIHGKIKASDKNWLKKFQIKGIEKAKEWHKSKNGIIWHKKHYNNIKNKLHQTINLICQNCNNNFDTINIGINKFCSNNCKSAYRRKLGVDNEERYCTNCNTKFTTNKYKKTKYCSRNCIYKNKKN